MPLAIDFLRTLPLLHDFVLGYLLSPRCRLRNDRPIRKTPSPVGTTAFPARTATPRCAGHCVLCVLTACCTLTLTACLAHGAVCLCYSRSAANQNWVWVGIIQSNRYLTNIIFPIGKTKRMVACVTVDECCRFIVM